MEKLVGLKAVAEQIAKGRWEEARKPFPKELKATSVIAVEIEEASAKRRTGNVGDEKSDEHLEVWAGVVPIKKTYGEIAPDPNLRSEIPVPESVLKLLKEE